MVSESGYSVRLYAKDLTVAYDGVQALRCPELEVEGSVIAAVGHNGAGKSTLLKSILGLLPLSSGAITAYESETGRVLTPEADMAFCPEMGAVFADISVESYIKLWCRIKHNDGSYYRRQGSIYIELLRLEPLLRKLGRELSKGERRRVQTAVGFLCEPRFFLFDEPFDGLDVQKTGELAEILHSQRSRMSIVVSSHRMDVVERLADVILVLREGEVETVGSVEKVCRDLCGDSFLVSNVTDPPSLLEFLEVQLPGSLIYQIGNRIRVIGGVDEGAISRLVMQHDRNGAETRRTPSSLVDAMNFHLRKLG